MATQGDVLDLVRDRLDEATPHQWSNEQLRRWINEGVRDVARRTECLMMTDTVAGVIGQHDYTLPTDIVRVHRVEWRPSSGDNIYPMQYVELKDGDHLWSTTRETQEGTPTTWTLWGFSPSLKMLVYPTPAEAGNFQVWSYQMPANLAVDGTAAGTTLGIPTGWEDLVADYAEYRALRKDRDPEWQGAKALYDEHLLDLAATAQKWADQGSVITPSGISIPHWLYAED